MIQIKLVKYRIFLHSCDGSLTLVNKLESCTNVLGYICIHGTFFKSHMPNPSLRHATNEARRRIFPSFNNIEWGRELEIFSKRLYVFISAPWNVTKLWIVHHYSKDVCPGLELRKSKLQTKSASINSISNTRKGERRAQTGKSARLSRNLFKFKEWVIP